MLPVLIATQPINYPKNRSGNTIFWRWLVRKIFIIIPTICLITILASSIAFAQSYSFNLSEGVADVYLNEDGSARIEYTYNFQNDPFAVPIEFVDLAFPSYTDVDINSISASVNGQPAAYIAGQAPIPQ